MGGVLSLALVCASTVQAIEIPGPLSSLTVPEPSNLNEFVKSKEWAIKLGKIFFWDMQVGSDGVQSCASCHYNAFADTRIKNQVNPGGVDSGDTKFGWVDIDACNRLLEDIGPNYTLTENDFPLRRGFGRSECDTDDVVSSQGVVGTKFGATTKKGDVDISSEGIDGDGTDADGFIHPVAGTLVRRVEPRNTPTVINSVFYLRQFWDGRAMPNFNGVNPDGSIDENAFVVEKVSGRGGGSLQPVEVSIDNSSLASQAVGPPLSLFEMSANHRRLPDLGYKMYHMAPLAKQIVSKKDSVLGKLANGNSPGLQSKYTYEYLVKQAFHEKWWAGHKKQVVCVAKPENPITPQVAISDTNGNCPDLVNYDKFKQKEYNFALFWGLAIQLYEATLISGNTPFDLCAAEADPFACLGSQDPAWERGLRIFVNDENALSQGNCVTCHRGPMFSGATVNEFINNGRFGEVAMIDFPAEIPSFPIGPGSGNVGLYDLGFANVGNSDTAWDLGIGGTFSDGTPLSFSANFDAGATELGSISLGTPFCDPDVHPDFDNCTLGHDVVLSDGAFKTPDLRNRKWMGPHFHNGDADDIRGAMGFYNAGGNENLTKDVRLLDINIPNNAAGGGRPRDDLVAFLAEALADPDVEFQRAPFDHPELCIPHGHDDETGETIFRHIEAVGKDGSSKPLVTFGEMLDQDAAVLANRANSLQNECPEYMLPVDKTDL
jgi:cytochrome c peroxidase